MSDKDDEAPRKPGKKRKELSPHYQKNNDGGYGNPPVRHQFKKGGPPGPGRKAGETGIETEMRRMLNGKVPLKSGGSTSYPEALALAARDTSLKKTVASTKFGLSLFEEYGPKEPQKPVIDLSVLTNAELAHYGAFIHRAYKVPPSPPLFNPLGTVSETGEGIFRVAKDAYGHLHFERIGRLDDKVVIVPADDRD